MIRGASVEDVCFLFWDAPLEERQKLAPEIIVCGHALHECFNAWTLGLNDDGC